MITLEQFHKINNFPSPSTPTSTPSNPSHPPIPPPTPPPPKQLQNATRKQQAAPPTALLSLEHLPARKKRQPTPCRHFNITTKTTPKTLFKTLQSTVCILPSAGAFNAASTSLIFCCSGASDLKVSVDSNTSRDLMETVCTAAAAANMLLGLRMGGGCEGGVRMRDERESETMMVQTNLPSRRYALTRRFKCSARDFQLLDCAKQRPNKLK